MTQDDNKQNLIGAYLGWAVVAVFFFYQYILRVSPGVIIEELRREFSLTADQFATLGSYYLYAYSLLQIPLGFIVDKIGVRKTVLASIFLCMSGAYLLTIAPNFAIAKLSRVIVGAGSAAAFMCALKIVADRIPAGKRGYLMGGTLALGTIGALTAGKPFVWLVDDYGWRNAVNVTVLLGFALLILVAIFVPKRDANRPTLKDAKSGALMGDLLGILKNRKIMLYAFLAIGLYTPLSALADLWGTAFIKEKFELSRAEAAHTSMMMYVGLALGSFVLPGLCEQKHRLNRAIQICGVGLLVLFTIILYGPKFSPNQLTLLLIVLGFFCGAEMMCFAGATLYTTPDNSGLTIGVVNTLNMLGGAILQQAIGTGLDFQWKGYVDADGIRQYTTSQFVASLSLLILIIGLCVISSLWLRDKKKYPNEQ